MIQNTRPTPPLSGTLTHTAARQLGVMEAAGKSVRFNRSQDGRFAENIHYKGEYIGSIIMISPDGIIED